MSEYEYRYIIEQEYLIALQLKYALRVEKRRKGWLFNGPWWRCEFLGFHDTKDEARIYAEKHKNNGGCGPQILSVNAEVSP